MALLAAVSFSALGALRAGADDPAPAPDAPRGTAGAVDPISSLEAGVLKRATLVVLGAVRVVRVGVGGSPTIAHVDTEKTLFAKGGAVAEPSFSLFVGGPHITDVVRADEGAESPRRPMAPYLAEGADGRYVLFLLRSPAGSGWSLDTLFPIVGDEGVEKVDVLAKELKLASIADPAERRRKTLVHFLETSRAERPWSRVHGARELYALSLSNPELFTPDVIREIDALRAQAFDPALRSFLAATRARVAGAAAPPSGAGTPTEGAQGGGNPSPRRRPPPPPEFFSMRRALAETKDPAKRIEAMSALATVGKEAAAPDLLAAMDASEAPVRERAAILLGDVGAFDEWPTLWKRFDAELDPAVREAIVRAGGLLGDDRDVPWVRAQGATPCLRRAACFALARIRTPAALDVLVAWARETAAPPAPDGAASRLIEYLRSPAFAEAERIAGRVVGPRRGSGGSTPQPPQSPPSPEPKEAAPKPDDQPPKVQEPREGR